MSPELFTIPLLDFAVKGYGLMLTLGFIAAILLALRGCRRLNENPAHVLWLAALSLTSGVLGARLLHVLHNCRALISPHLSTWSRFLGPIIRTEWSPLFSLEFLPILPPPGKSV